MGFCVHMDGFRSALMLSMDADCVVFPLGVGTSALGLGRGAAAVGAACINGGRCKGAGAVPVSLSRMMTGLNLVPEAAVRLPRAIGGEVWRKAEVWVGAAIGACCAVIDRALGGNRLCIGAAGANMGACSSGSGGGAAEYRCCCGTVCC